MDAVGQQERHGVCIGVLSAMLKGSIGLVIHLQKLKGNENETQETNQTTIPTLRHLRPLWTTRPHEKLRLLLLHHAGMDDSCANDSEILRSL